ncbi:MAG: sigma 54-interacting transcriptional regulator [bacterium]
MATPQEIDGRYRILKTLGEGLTGEVYLVESAGGRSALKLLKPFADRALEAELVAAFKFEFAFLKDLRHPNVVRIQDFGFDPKLRRFYFTEEFLEGKALPEFARGLSPAEIGKLFVQAVSGLQAIHRARLLHGDIKGNNLWVVPGPEGPCLKIIDLGLADPRFSASGGTPATMAPEKILKEPADERSDLYSLGVVFYQLFSGANPFARKTLKETYEAHLTHLPPKLSLANPKVPASWNEIFETLLAKNPAHRYRNAAELLAAIDFAQPAKSGAARPRPWRLERWMGRKALLDELSEKLRKALRSKGPRQAFLLAGEPGVGKSRMAQELKYQFQMEKVRVAAPPEADADFWIGEGDRENPAAASWPRDPKAPAVLLLTMTPDQQGPWERELRASGWKCQRILIPPLSREELETFLQELSGLPAIPENFLQGLWENTRGNPQLVVSLLENLAQRQRLVDAQGRWNLSVFQEADLDLKALDLELSDLDAALAALPAADHAGRAEFWMRRGEELLKKNQNEAAGESLAQAEAEAQQIEDLAAKLAMRAGVYERQGLREIRDQRFDEARLRFERALTLLEEAGLRDGPRWLRVQNYLAWLHCQEGKIDAAIALFTEAQAGWRALPPEAQAQVRNQDLGYAYLLKGDAVRAITELLVMLPFYEKLQDAQLLMKVHYNLGEAYLLARDYPAAIESFSRGAELMRTHRNFEFLLRAYNGLGKARHLQGEWEAALSDYGRGLDLARYLEDYASAAALSQNIGSIQAERGAFQPARENFELALKFLKKLPSKSAHAKYLQARALVELGDLLRREGRYAEAEAQARDADRMAAQDEALAGFRFWTLLTRAEIARDEGHRVRLGDLLAELLPLADDDEKRARCAEFRAFAAAGGAPPSAPDQPEGNQTRVEAVDPEASLLLAQRRVAEERDPEALRRLVRELQERLDRAQQELTLAREQAVESSVLGRFAERDFLSRNPRMVELFRTVERVRDTDLSVVLHGESGTGKELLARSLHERSRRHTGPFVAVNCAALPAALVEAELFGYRAGAFTGANRDKAGLIEAAEGGTLFLDEIAELELPLQAKLLRVLQEKELTRLGETRPRAVQFRLLSASHRNLRGQVEAGKFREDLYFRVAELELDLPPLRERPEDIPLLAERFVQQFLQEHGESVKVGLGREFLKALLDYEWPGNVRELENLIRVATALRRGTHLSLEGLPESWRQRLQGKGGRPARETASVPSAASTCPPDLPLGPGQSWREAETRILAKALICCDFDVPRAAASLACAPSKLYQRIREDRIAERQEEWQALPWNYREGERLADLKRRVFAAALAEAGGSAYRAARRLGVSPGMVYKWQ